MGRPVSGGPSEARQGPPRIRNAEALLSHGSAGLRETALSVAAAGLESCDPSRAVERAVSLDGDRLLVAGVEHRLDPGAKLVVLGAGKATLSIAAALERILGNRLTGGAIVVRDPGAPLRRIEVLSGEHPVPGELSLAGARRLVELAGELRPGDIALCCFTGGSSALASLPPDGVPFADKRALHALLLTVGLSIGEINTARKHVSAVKGGRLAEVIAPAAIVNLTVSDVPDDRLDMLTDLTVRDGTTAADAMAVLRDHRLLDRVPASVLAHLDGPEAESPTLDEVDIQSVLLVTGASVCEAMAAAARAAGVAPIVLSTSIEGEARELGRQLARLARESAERGEPFPAPCVLIACGGEATVTLDDPGAFGGGGPNQEAALAAALELAGGAAVATVFLDTDGSDGGTGVAGGIADGMSAQRASDAGIQARPALLEHRSAEAVRALADQIESGPTGTNVNDLIAIAIGPPGAGELA